MELFKKMLAIAFTTAIAITGTSDVSAMKRVRENDTVEGQPAAKKAKDENGRVLTLNRFNLKDPKNPKWINGKPVKSKLALEFLAPFLKDLIEAQEKIQVAQDQVTEEQPVNEKEISIENIPSADQNVNQNADQNSVIKKSDLLSYIDSLPQKRVTEEELTEIEAELQKAVKLNEPEQPFVGNEMEVDQPIKNIPGTSSTDDCPKALGKEFFQNYELAQQKPDAAKQMADKVIIDIKSDFGICFSPYDMMESEDITLIALAMAARSESNENERIKHAMATYSERKKVLRDFIRNNTPVNANADESSSDNDLMIIDDKSIKPTAPTLSDVAKTQAMVARHPDIASRMESLRNEIAELSNDPDENKSVILLAVKVKELNACYTEAFERDFKGYGDSFAGAHLTEAEWTDIEAGIVPEHFFTMFDNAKYFFDQATGKAKDLVSKGKNLVKEHPVSTLMLLGNIATGGNLTVLQAGYEIGKRVIPAVTNNCCNQNQNQEELGQNNNQTVDNNDKCVIQ